jgi:hypothetical protein
MRYLAAILFPLSKVGAKPFSRPPQEPNYFGESRFNIGPGPKRTPPPEATR